MTAKELYIMVAETIIQLMEWVIKCVEEESFINLIIEGGVVRELAPEEQPEPEPTAWLYRIKMLGNMNVYSEPEKSVRHHAGYAIKNTTEFVYKEQPGWLRISPSDTDRLRWIVDSDRWVEKELKQ